MTDDKSINYFQIRSYFQPEVLYYNDPSVHSLALMNSLIPKVQLQLSNYYYVHMYQYTIYVCMQSASANFSNAAADASQHTAVENFSQVTGGSASKPKTLTIIITKLKIKHKRNYLLYYLSWIEFGTVIDSLFREKYIYIVGQAWSKCLIS